MFALLKVAFTVVVLSAAEGDLGDAQTHAMLQVNSRGEAVKYNDVRAEIEDEADESEDEADDGLEVAREAGSKYVVSDAHMEAGKKLWKSEMGPLFTKYVKAMYDLTGYWATVIQRAGQNMGNVTDDLIERPSKQRIATILANWTAALRNHRHLGNCSRDVFMMEECMGFTRCLIEPHVGVNQSIAPYLFAAVIELEDITKTVVMKDFLVYFNTSSGSHAHPCEDDMAHNADPSLSQVSSEQATSAVATVAKVHTASKRMAQLLTPSNTSVLALLQPADFESAWHEPCAALGCNPGSWLDVMDSLHGHAAELAKVQAPARAIRLHVSAMRAAQHAMRQAAGTSTAFLANFGTLLNQGVLKKRRATSAYRSLFKEAGGTLDGAIAEWWGADAWNAVTNLNWCWSISLNSVTGYVKKMPATSDWAVVCSMTFENWRQIGVSNLWKLMTGQTTCEDATIKLQFGLLIGRVLGAPEAIGLAAGLSISAQFDYNVCHHNLNLELSLSVQGMVSTGSVDCPFGTPLWGVFPCVQGYAIGVNVLCCNVNLLTGENNCQH
mmetsp:Transcript_96171/g.272266  ORF Transcript_96171/g.272266 Transcript_96171/m.272266 type:complete len:552 (-) Transcript_96171:673-2328(-)